MQKPPSPALSFASWIVYEDDALVAVNKPAGVPSQGGEGMAGINVVDLARAHLALAHVGVLHRLDRNVSGLVLLARTPRAARAVSMAIAAGKVLREYVAVARGAPPEDAFSIEAHLRKDPVRNEVRARSAEDVARIASPAARAEWKPSRTEVRVIERLRAGRGAAAVLEVRPITGRSHQIRAHLAFVGLPLYGDPKYGVALPGVNRPLLHAARMSLAHPTEKRVLELAAPLPWTDGELRAWLARA